MKQFGIDVSRWQGDFNFANAVNEGVKFVVIKGGGGDDGLYVDRMFADNYKKAKALGLSVGCYWFSKALTVAAAKEEAKFLCEKVLADRQFELPIYIDVENKVQLAVGKRLLTDIIKAWMEYMNDRGFYPGIYSSKSYFASYMYDKELQAYPHWIACWAKSCTYTPESCFGMWQFGGETNLLRSNKVSGVVCDQDYLLIDYPSIIKAAGKNGFGKTTRTVTKPTNSTGVVSNNNTSKEVCNVNLPVLRKGDMSGYVKTVQILLNKYNNAGLAEDAGFGAKTDAAVRAYQKSRRLSVDGVVGAQTWAQLLR